MNKFRQKAISTAFFITVGFAPLPLAAQAGGGQSGAKPPVFDTNVATMPAPAGISAQPAAAPAPAPANAYRINIGDELEVYVWGEERLQRTVRVLPDGTMAFPLIGQMSAQGKLLTEMEALISDKLRGQYRGQVPQVTVSIKSPSGLQFSVMGKVRSPGTFSPGRYVNVLDALSLAGGPAEFANLENVLIIRRVGDGLRSMRVKLGSLFKSGTTGTADMSSIQNIQAGDTVIVP